MQKINTSIRRLCLAATALTLGLALVAGSPRPAPAETTEPAAKPEHLLRYRFRPEQTLRWSVQHVAKFRTSVSGIAQEDESITKSTKVWRVVAVDPEGNATIEHRVDDIEMSNTIDGREQHYDSKRDRLEDVPVAFKAVAETVGVPLFEVTLSPRGEELDRVQKRTYTESPHTQITLVFPEEPVAVGESWTHPFEVSIPLANQAVKKIQMREKFTLEDVRTGMATIHVATQILTPVHDPELKAQLLQHLWDGTIKFDMHAGCVAEQQKDIDESTVGIRGEASTLHYRMRMTEELLKSSAPPRTARVAP